MRFTLINGPTQEELGSFCTNRRVTVDEIIESIGGEIIDDMNDDRFSEDGDNVLVNGKRYWYEELEVEEDL